jgi:adenylosuccinate synthase
VGDVSSAVSGINDAGGAVLFEAAQGTMLDIHHGTYPYVTSSSSIASYAPTGLGIPASASRRILGVTKAYATRVGAGPFPTEQKGKLADSIRTEGKEYGTATGRPRRIGWLDLVALKYAVKMNGAKELVLSKIDVLAKVRDPRACVAYRHAGTESGDFYRFMANLDKVKPVYETVPSLYGAEFRSGVPAPAKKLIKMIEDETGARVKLLSYGEERRRTIEL